MRRLLISTTALSVAISPLSTMPAFAQVMNEDGSVTGLDGTVLCVPTSEVVCDLEAIIEALKVAEEAAAAEAAAVEAAAVKAAEEEAAAKAAEEAAAAEAAAAKAAEEEAAAKAAEEEAAAKAAEEEAAAKAAEEAAAAEAAAQAEAEAAAAKAADEEAAAKAAEEAAAAEAAAQAEAEAAAAKAAEEEAAAKAAEEAAAAEAAAQAEADAAAAKAAEEEAAAKAAEEAAAAEAAAQAEAEAAAAKAAEEEAAAAAAEEAAAAETSVSEEPIEGVIDSATGEPVDPEVAAEALAEAEAELAITEGGEVVDPAAGLKVAAEDPTLEIVPVEVPEVSEGEVESLTQLLTADPTAIEPSALAAAETVSAPAPEDGTVVLAEPDPAALVAAVTETITEESVRTSAEEFAAPPVAMAAGTKSKLSDLEKAGLVVLGALVVGSIINANKAKAEERRVVSNTGDRVIVLRPDGTYQVLKDDDTVIRRPGSTVRTETFRDGSTRTIVERPDGTQVVTIRDATGRVLRRATYDDRGRELVLIDDLVEEEVVIVRDLPRPKKKIVISSKDEDSALKRELARLEAEKAGRKFSLRQIREIPEVRDLAATIDVEPVKFATGSAAVTAEEARNLADLGRVMQELLDENPAEVFLVMGHTDATGKTAMNLALSDRRAESVALALTEYFDIPPENMIVQGYGETELLIDTQENEPLNRRVEVKVITPLMRTAELR
ncbi:MAG: OmpA family protein [Tabrizicola sp.]|nr:OmpA family protein [Tabrizicola sp.]